MRKTVCYVAGCVALLLTAPAIAQDMPAKELNTALVAGPARMESLPLRVGTRITYFVLLQDKGNLEDNKFTDDMSINTLTAEQDYLPLKVYMDWFFSGNYGIEVTWDRIEAGADTKSRIDEDEYESYRDGVFSLTGPICSFIGEYPVTIASLPCRISWGLGLAYLLGDFQAEGWWSDRGNKTHSMEVDNTIGFLATADLRGYVRDTMSVDLYIRYLKADVDDTFAITFNDPGIEPESKTGTFPMDNIALGIGAGWDF